MKNAKERCVKESGNELKNTSLETPRKRILFICPGGRNGLSGISQYLVSALGKKYNIVKEIDPSLKGFWKYWNAFYCLWHLDDYSKFIHPFKVIKGEEISYFRRKTRYSINKPTDFSQKFIKKSDTFDGIFQITTIPVIKQKTTKPYYVWVDFTMKSEIREYPQSARFFFHPSDKEFRIKSEYKTFQNATTIFTASNYLKNVIISDYDIDEDKIVTTYEGIKLEKLPHINKKEYSSKKIIFVGTDFERKGGYTLLKAFKEVKKEIKDAKLIIAGISSKINIPGVSIVGRLPYEETVDLYNNGAIFAMPSIYEPFGLVFLEAMTFKLPCIGSDTDAMPEIIKEGKTGFLVKPNDHKALAEKIILLLENENLMKEMGEKGRERVEKYFTWEHVVNRISNEIGEDLKE